MNKKKLTQLIDNALEDIIAIKQDLTVNNKLNTKQAINSLHEQAILIKNITNIK